MSRSPVPHGSAAGKKSPLQAKGTGKAGTTKKDMNKSGLNREKLVDYSLGMSQIRPSDVSGDGFLEDDERRMY